jgi:5'-AMP-activated protein kinase catalytic alpha subunit
VWPFLIFTILNSITNFVDMWRQQKGQPKKEGPSPDGSLGNAGSLPTGFTMNTQGILKIGNYRLGKTLGLGSFGKVKVAEHEATGHKVAVKILNRSKIKAMPRMDEKIQREIQMLKLLRHPHIIKLYEVIETSSDIFMIMEYVSGGELFDYIVSHGRLSEDEARRFFQQIISGVEYCHRHRIVHRDLKPENLLLDASRSNVKIADFGLSNFMQDGDFLTTSCGSPNYAAPEVISGQLYAGPEVDIWSCGVILYALVCARLPFDDEHIPNLFKKIRLGAYSIPSHVSPACKNLIQSMLIVDPMNRATIDQVRHHSWFQTNLPQYLKYIPEQATMRRIEDIDDSVVRELCQKFELEKDEAVTMLLAGEDEESPEAKDLKVAYHLIYDAKRLYFASNEKEAEVETTHPLPDTGALSREVGSVGSGGERIEDDQREGKRWYLGVLSKHPPKEIMYHLYLSLKNNSFEWKTVGTFQLRCRIVEDRDTKIAIQLYRIKQGQYLLDFKRLSGDTYLFFSSCARVMSSLSQSLAGSNAPHVLPASTLTSLS